MAFDNSFSAIRPLFRTAMNSLIKFKEWKDAFNVQNIPSTIINDAYHIDTSSGGRKGAYDQNSQEIEHDVIIRVFKKGYRNTAEAIDAAMTDYGLILHTVLAPTNRLGSRIKNIYLNDVSIQPYDPSNDNIVLLEITFTCLMEICT